MKYFIFGFDRDEPGEIEVEFDDFEKARKMAARLIEEGGDAELFDENGTEYDPF